jgi:hypothetical protein
VPAPDIISSSRGVDQMRDVLTEPNRGDRVEAQLGGRKVGRIREHRQHRAEGFPGKILVEIDLEIIEQADEIVFRGRHEGPLYVDHHESFGFGLPAPDLVDEMEVFGLEVSMGEAAGRVLE